MTHKTVDPSKVTETSFELEEMTEWIEVDGRSMQAIKLPDGRLAYVPAKDHLGQLETGGNRSGGVIENVEGSDHVTVSYERTTFAKYNHTDWVGPLPLISFSHRGSPAPEGWNALRKEFTSAAEVKLAMAKAGRFVDKLVHLPAEQKQALHTILADKPVAEVVDGRRHSLFLKVWDDLNERQGPQTLRVGTREKPLTLTLTETAKDDQGREFQALSQATLATGVLAPELGEFIRLVKARHPRAAEGTFNVRLEIAEVDSVKQLPERVKLLADERGRPHTDQPLTVVTAKVLWSAPDGSFAEVTTQDVTRADGTHVAITKPNMVSDTSLGDLFGEMKMRRFVRNMRHLDEGQQDALIELLSAAFADVNRPPKVTLSAGWTNPLSAVRDRLQGIRPPQVMQIGNAEAPLRFSASEKQLELAERVAPALGQSYKIARTNAGLDTIELIGELTLADTSPGGKLAPGIQIIPGKDGKPQIRKPGMILQTNLFRPLELSLELGLGREGYLSQDLGPRGEGRFKGWGKVLRPEDL